MRKSIKILIVIPSLTLGGAEKQALEYALALKKNGNEPFILGLGREGDLVSKLTVNGIKFGTYSFSSFFSGNKFQQFLFLLRFIAYLRKHKFDAVIAFTYWPNVILKLTHRFSNIKKMYWNQRSVDDKLQPVFWERLGRFFKVNYIANSKASASSIIHRHQLRQNEVSVIYNVMDLSDSTPKRKENKQGCDIVMVANFFEEKDQFTLIKAFSQLKEDYKNQKLKLHLFGSAPGNGKRLLEAKQLAFDLGLTSKEVIFYGSNSNVKELLKSMDIGVLSTYSEGFSNAIMEYMDAGLPIIATDIPANREAIGEQNLKWLFSIEDKSKLVDLLKLLIDDNVLRQCLGDKNRERTKLLFNKERLEEELINDFNILPSILVK